MTRQITVDIPEEVAARFERAVPAEQRDKYVADAIREFLEERAKASRRPDPHGGPES
jgi:metal-responsive CopG/Arc/MetJ family transcriptional regulator